MIRDRAEEPVFFAQSRLESKKEMVLCQKLDYPEKAMRKARSYKKGSCLLLLADFLYIELPEIQLRLAYGMGKGVGIWRC